LKGTKVSVSVFGGGGLFDGAFSVFPRPVLQSVPKKKQHKKYPYPLYEGIEIQSRPWQLWISSKAMIP